MRKIININGSSNKLIVSLFFLFFANFGWGQTSTVTFPSDGTTQYTSDNQTTWTVPAGVTSVMVEVWGGGGGGTAKTSGGYAGGGGGGGAYARKYSYSVSPDQILYIQVGKRGDRGGSSGGAGGTSYVKITSHSGTVIASASGGGGAVNSSTSTTGGSGSSTREINSASPTANDDWWNGGNGGGGAGSAGRGAGGGGGAGSGGAGSNGAAATAGTGTGGAGGIALSSPVSSLNGGSGGGCTGVNASGSNGAIRGGGGGGAGTGTSSNGGHGGGGFVRITYVACSSLTSAGAVTGDQTFCSGGDPLAFTSTADASGGSGGTIGYQWESSTTSSITGYSDIAGATSSTYDPPSGITTTTYYRRKARRCGGSWEQTTSFITVTVNPLPILNGVIVSSNCWKTDNATNYTITVSATGTTPTSFDGSTYGVLALINLQGTNAGQYGGYFAWNSTTTQLNTIGYTKNQMACSGGGFVGMYNPATGETYGADKATLISASTTVSGNTRTVSFVVRPNTNFPTLSGNSISQYASSTNGCDAGWTETTNLFNSAPNSTTSPTSVSAGVTISSVCEGGTIALQGTATGATDWSWVGPNNYISSSEDPTIVSATTAASGTYFLTPSNACGTGSGVFDNFNDANFTANPVWTPQTTTVLTTWSTGVNFLRGADTYSQEVISTPSTQVYGSWKFDFTMAAVDNSNHIVSFKFISSNSALSGDGYHVTVRGNATMSSSTIRLERFSGAQNPTAAGNTLLGSPYTWIGANTSAHTILVTRNTTGIFNVYLDGTLIITSLADLTYTSSTHAGFWTNSTAAATNHIMDNVACSDARVNVTVNQISATPTITSPICSGSTSVSGTSSEVTGSTVTVFKNGVSWGTTTTITSSNWTVSGTALAANDIITATVQASGKCVSNISSSVTINLSNYRSKTTGNWNVISTWEVSCDNGTTWSDAIQTPTSSDGTITIRSPHTVTVAGTPTVDQVTVEAGGTVQVNISQINIANGSDAYDFIVKGTLITTDNTVDNIIETGVLFIDDGGLYVNNVNTASGYGTHPTATWHLNSTCEVRGLSGSTLPNNFNQVYGNLLWNCVNQGSNAVVIEQTNAPTVQGTLRVANTGTGSLVFCNTTTAGNWATVNNLEVSGGNFYVAGLNAGFSSALRDYKMTVNSLNLLSGILDVGRSNDLGTYNLTVTGNAVLSGGLMRVMNNSGTGARVSTFNVNGNLTISGSILDLSAIGSTNAGRVFLKGDFTMSGGSVIFTQGLTAGSSGIYFDGTNTQNFIFSGGTISTLSGDAGRRFYFKNSSGPTAINETYSSLVAQVTVNGTEGSPSNAGSYSSWPTSGALINNLTINNLNGVTLSTAKTVNGNLNLTNGILTTTSSNLLYIANTSTNAINGGGSSAYVSGPLKWAVTNSGGTYMYQIGKNGKYAPAGIVDPSSGSTDFMAEYFNADPNTANYTRTSKESIINNVSACEYWMIDKPAGSASAKVILSWDTLTRSCRVRQPSDLLVLRWSGSQWTNLGNQSTTGGINTGTVTASSSINTFSPFTLGSIGNLNPLPVSLLNINASCINKNVKLNWQTASEINNDYFDVERSVDGNSYTSLLRINGNGTTNEPQQYTTYDEQPISGSNYYRLKQVDFNGSTTYYNPVIVNCNQTDSISIYPNPNNGSFVVSGISEEEEIQLTDALGRTLFNKKGEINYEVNNLQEGIYFVIIKNKFGLVQTQKIVVQR